MVISRARDRQHLLLATREMVAPAGAPAPRGGGTVRTPPRRSQRPGRAATVRFSSTLSEGKISRSCATQPRPSARAVRGTRRDVAAAHAMVPRLTRVKP